MQIARRHFKNWNFLTGDQAKILNWKITGFTTLFAGEDSNAEGGFEHSGMFALVDKQGKHTLETG